MNVNKMFENLSEEIHAMSVKKEKTKLKLTELEKQEKVAVQKLMEATLKEKKGNEAMLKATQESLNYLTQKLDERKAYNKIVIKQINQNRDNLLMIDIKDREVSQNHSDTTKHMMEKIQEQTEVVEKQTIILQRTCEFKESIKHFHSKITDLKSEIINKQNELDYILNTYLGLSKVCQDMQQKNISKSLACKEMEEKAVLLQSNVDSLNNDLKKLTSE